MLSPTEPLNLQHQLHDDCYFAVVHNYSVLSLREGAYMPSVALVNGDFDATIRVSEDVRLETISDMQRINFHITVLGDNVNNCFRVAFKGDGSKFSDNFLCFIMGGGAFLMPHPLLY